MATAAEGSQYDSQFDAKMSELLSAEGDDFFTSYDEVYGSFDAMGLQENLLRGTYAYAEGSQYDTREFDAKMTELLSADGDDFFTSYDEVYDSFDAMGLQENLLRGIYAYGFDEKPSAIQQRGSCRVCLDRRLAAKEQLEEHRRHENMEKLRKDMEKTNQLIARACWKRKMMKTLKTQTKMKTIKRHLERRKIC